MHAPPLSLERTAGAIWRERGKKLPTASRCTCAPPVCTERTESRVWRERGKKLPTASRCSDALIPAS